MLRVIGLHFQYHGLHLLENVNCEVEKGQIVALVGPNGAGKTTLLKCIARILKPSRGTVLIDDRPIETFSRRDIAKNIGYVPQNTTRRFSLTVFDAVLCGRRPYLAWRPSLDDIKLTAEVIRQMNLSELAMRDVDRLSGGEAQKVMLARALVQQAPYLLLDEPTSSLDLRCQLEILEAINFLAKGKKIGVFMAMHDLSLAARFSDRIIMLRGGRIFRSGTPKEVITPANIAEVYGVHAGILKEDNHIYIQPLHCIKPR